MKKTETRVASAALPYLQSLGILVLIGGWVVVWPIFTRIPTSEARTAGLLLATIVSVGIILLITVTPTLLANRKLHELELAERLTEFETLHKLDLALVLLCKALALQNQEEEWQMLESSAFVAWKSQYVSRHGLTRIRGCALTGTLPELSDLKGDRQFAVMRAILGAKIR